LEEAQENYEMARAEYRNAGRKFFPAVVFEQIVERAAATGLSIEALCLADVSLPSASTVYSALQADPELNARYVEARQKLTEKQL
jgi:hypothetical protein